MDSQGLAKLEQNRNYFNKPRKFSIPGFIGAVAGLLINPIMYYCSDTQSPPPLRIPIAILNSTHNPTTYLSGALGCIIGLNIDQSFSANPLVTFESNPYMSERAAENIDKNNPWRRILEQQDNAA